MFKKEIDHIELLVCGKGDFGRVPIELCLYALEKIKQHQEIVAVKIDIGILGRKMNINTAEIKIDVLDINCKEWLVCFGEYDVFLYDNFIIKTPANFRWLNEKQFEVKFSQKISDSKYVFVKFFGDIGELTKENYFAG
ncbi:hypothetical protein EXW52_27910 (plasmid) [Bacillus mycoides]|uniref:hypothetical protein n=1 Tax=Bacillus mycoides TaxID=1405 RepID=UPI001C037603|nr:hypothetical protein [Bacillus mycoides]QWH03973.1 hypothetical protein EXW52_27910 [Bacillus mycoides]